MSYCRWSTDDFQCDVYCYADVSGGYTTHVKAYRYPADIPKIDHLFTKDTIPEYVAAMKERSKWCETAKALPIGLPHDGQTFNDPTLEDFKARLLSLRDVGYRFPDQVLETIDEEIKEGAEQ